MASIRKAGTVVVTGIGNEMPQPVGLSMLDVAMFQKRIQGALFGMMNPQADVPRLLRLWQSGKLKLEELATRSYALDEINEGYADMHAGKNIRGVVHFDS